MRQAPRKRQQGLAHTIASGVYAVAREIEPIPHPLPLFVRAPIQYVAEQQAAVLCDKFELGNSRRDDVGAYLMAGLGEYAVAFFSEFDVEHFERWTAAVTAHENPV